MNLSVVRNYLRDAIADDAEACEAIELFCAEGSNPLAAKNLEDIIACLQMNVAKIQEQREG